VLVAKAGVTRRSAFREMMAMLPRENLIGTFLNYSNPPRHARSYARYADENERAEIPGEVEEADSDANRRSLAAETDLREPVGQSDD
jgi:hypothetical protein